MSIIRSGYGCGESYAIRVLPGAESVEGLHAVIGETLVEYPGCNSEEFTLGVDEERLCLRVSVRMTSHRARIFHSLHFDVLLAFFSFLDGTSAATDLVETAWVESPTAEPDLHVLYQVHYLSTGPGRDDKSMVFLTHGQDSLLQFLDTFLGNSGELYAAWVARRAY